MSEGVDPGRKGPQKGGQGGWTISDVTINNFIIYVCSFAMGQEGGGGGGGGLGAFGTNIQAGLSRQIFLNYLRIISF